MEGVMTEMPITTAEEKAQRRLEVKARSTLMMGIPNEHQLRFNSIKDAKKLLEAQYENFTAPSSKMLDQKFDRLQKLNTHAIVWRNKANLDTMSMDDLYKNLKVYEPEVKGMSSSSSSIQNMAFVSSSNNNTSSTNEAVNTAHGSDQTEEGPNYALMAFASSCRDLEVSNESICLKSCLEIVELIKSQNDNLFKDLKKSELMVLDKFVNEPVVENIKAMSSEEDPKVVRKYDDAPSIEE
ncbi:hypothetical protein Tco_1426476 [Tanacetum coccineum]